MKSKYKYKISELIEFLNSLLSHYRTNSKDYNGEDNDKLEEIKTKLTKHDELMNFDISEELDREWKMRQEECNSQ
jgi:hypothetical protein